VQKTVIYSEGTSYCPPPYSPEGSHAADAARRTERRSRKKGVIININLHNDIREAVRGTPLGGVPVSGDMVMKTCTSRKKYHQSNKRVTPGLQYVET